MVNNQDFSSGILNQLTNVANFLGLAWWVEIGTDTPRCTYYFGPFISGDDAESAKSGYVEDLEREGAQGIQVEVKRCKPETLTVDEDARQSQASPSFSGQL